MQINDNIKKARELKGYSQAKIAELLDEKRSTYAEWERNTVPKADVLMKIAQITGVPMDQLLDEKAAILGNNKSNSQPPSYIPVSWQDYLKLIHFNLERLMAGQNEILKQQAKTRAEVRGYGKYHLVKDAKGKRETFDRLLAEIDKLVNDELQDDDRQGNPADS